MKTWSNVYVQLFKVLRHISQAWIEWYFTYKQSKFLIKAKQLYIRNWMIMVLILMAKDLSQFLWCQCYIKKKAILQYNILRQLQTSSV